MTPLLTHAGSPAVRRVLDRLDAVKPSGDQFVARCPAHDDRNPSLTVKEGQNGRALLNCHAGCPGEDIVKAIGLSMRDLFDGEAGCRPGGPDAVYAYHDEENRLLYQVVRRAGKQFRQRRPDGAGDWVWKLDGVRRVPYRLPGLMSAAESRVVFIAEGEKDCDRLWAAGLLATCNAGGAGKWHTLDAAAVRAALAGRAVVILPDNDAAGAAHAADVAGRLAGVAAHVRVLALGGLPPGGDVSDWLNGEAEDGPDKLHDMAGRALEAPPGPPEPGDAPAEEPRYKPFPVDALPEPLAGYVTQAAESANADAGMVAVPLLVALSAAVGNTRRFGPKEDWASPPTLWGAVVGKSGSGKSPTMDHAMRFARERNAAAADENDRLRAELGEGDAPPPERRYIIQDITVEAVAAKLKENPRGLLIDADELRTWIGSFDKYSKGNGSDAAKWIQMHNGGHLTVDRASKESVSVKSALVAVAGGVQPGRLRQSLTAEHRESGLAARLLLCYPPESSGAYSHKVIDRALIASAGRAFGRLYDCGAGGPPRRVTVTGRALQLYIEHHDGLMRAKAGQPEHIAAALVKLVEYLGRVALVLHAAKWAAGGAAFADEPTEATPDTVAEAARIVHWFKDEMLRVYAMLDGPEERPADRLQAWLRQQGGEATPREVAHGVYGMRPTAVAAAALQELADRGLGKWVERKSPQGTRPARCFRLS